MRLERIQEFMKKHNMPYTYFQEDGCGSINFSHRGLTYHIWEYNDPQWGAESNVLSCGRGVDYEGDYEQQILDIMETWGV